MREATKLDDQILVREFKRSRNGECFAVLFDRYGKRLYALGYRIHQDRARAEDCVQETFRRAIEEIDCFDERSAGSNFWGWLVTIAEHVCLDELRRMRVREDHAKASSAGPWEHGGPVQDQQAMLSELRDELTRLCPEYRLCYLLFHVNGYSYKEIMNLTGFSYQQVKTCIQTARRHIERRFR